MHRSIPVSFVLASMLLVGCTTTKYTLSGSWPYIDAQPTVEENTTPQRIIAIWSHDVVNTVGKKPTQGFTGRLFFYDKKSRPIEVEGRLTIFAFDDSRIDDPDWEPKNKPDKKFVFTKEQLPNHLGTSNMGKSYSIWIPWQQIGGTRKTVSLIPVLTTKDGLRIAGPPTKHVLPGKSPRKEQSRITVDPQDPKVLFPSANDLRHIIQEARNRQDEGVQSAGFNQESNSGAIGKERATKRGTSGFMGRTMTIDMSHNMMRNYVNRNNSYTPAPVNSGEGMVARKTSILSQLNLPVDNLAEQLIKPPLPVAPVRSVRPHSAAGIWKPTLRPSSIQSYGDDTSWASYRRR
jgi:hypothetical protein